MPATTQLETTTPFVDSHHNPPPFDWNMVYNSSDIAYGGGALDCTLNNCTLSGNSVESGGNAVSGGGASSSTLNNCTLTGNWLDIYSVSSFSITASGGGASGCTLNNCTLSGNWASSQIEANTITASSTASGGGADGCVLNNCTLTGNAAYSHASGACCFPYESPADGGGAAYSTLNNCTLAGNSAFDDGLVPQFGGGGAYLCALNNCIVYFNTANQQVANYYSDYSSAPINCCTTPLPAVGHGNITSAPMFVDMNRWANLRLQSNSPCINAGNNAYAAGSNDLDGRPRIVGGAVDIGAYEFQPGVSGVFIGWLQRYGLPTDGSADYTDPDGDGMNNWQEWRCGTNPTNALSALRLLAPATVGTNVIVTWQSVTGVNYFLERAANLSAPPAFTSLATNIPGQSGTTAYIDTNAIGTGPFFYRVGVGN